MEQDFKELLDCLNAEQVKYLVVGGYAVSLHAQPRATKDLDILIKPEAENAKALFRALIKFGAPLRNIKPTDFVKKGSFFRMGAPPIMVDIMPEISGIEFDQAFKRRFLATIDIKTKLKAFFISAQDLIISKESSAPPQDLADAAALRSAIRATNDTKVKSGTIKKKLVPKTSSRRGHKPNF